MLLGAHVLSTAATVEDTQSLDGRPVRVNTGERASRGAYRTVQQFTAGIDDGPDAQVASE